jgi:chemotaxis protein MotB
MKRKRDEGEHENLERWLITYADLITLLLAFFIMMYTFSKQDAQKYEEVSENLRSIFTGGSAILKSGTGGTSLINPTSRTGNPGAEVRRQLENQIETLPKSTEDHRGISILRDERGLVIRILDKAFFDEGKAELRVNAQEALRRLVPIIRDSGMPVRIEGHTDNVPINTGEFKSNWELSVRRATEVVRHLIERYDFPPRKISASGYGEYQPLARNDTAENRALNRRIEIILLNASGPGERVATASAGSANIDSSLPSVSRKPGGVVGASAMALSIP